MMKKDTFKVGSSLVNTSIGLLTKKIFFDQALHVLYVLQKIRMQCINGFSGTQKQAINFTK